MTQQNAARKKAELIAAETVYIPSNVTIPHVYERSTIGPSAGSKNIALSFQGHHIKLIASTDSNTRFRLSQLPESKQLQIVDNNTVFLDKVHLLPILYHAPYQAFFNLDARCIYSCAFCTQHPLKKQNLARYKPADFISLVNKGAQRTPLKAIALTSGIYPDTQSIITKMCSISTLANKKFPDIPIGVEPPIDNKKQLSDLHNAGVSEIKINLQTPDKEIFSRICPDLEYDTLYTMLTEATNIFGSGKVTTNLLYGLGETDASLLNVVEKLAQQGVISTLRKIRINNKNRRYLESALDQRIPEVTPERIYKLALKQKHIFSKNNLRPQTVATMCHSCGCCDLIPFWDV